MRKSDEIIFDVVVVGGGPAGASAAITCRKMGLSVAIIDKRSFPREKLCGGLFTGRAKKYYCEVFGEMAPSELLIEKQNIEFWQHGKLLASLNSFPSLFLTMRWDIDHHMFRKALESGAIDYSGNRVKYIDLGVPTVFLENGLHVRGQILIGADGVNSLVAKKIFGSSFDRETIGFGLEAEVENQNSPHNEPIRIDFSAASWGYGWSFPKNGTTTIGVGGLLSNNPEIRIRMDEYFSILERDSSVQKVKGHFLPFGTFRKSPGKDNVLLCGDAAGLVDPITGEGIAYAIKSGQLAGESAVLAISQLKPKIALKIYKNNLANIHKSLRIASFIRPLFFSSVFQNIFPPAFQRSRALKAEYMRLLAGEVEYPEIGVKILKRIPQYLLRTIAKSR